MLNISMTHLEKLMKSQIEQLGGLDKAIEACERMYSATFRSQPVKLATYEDWQAEVASLKIELAVSLYVANTDRQQPVRPDYFEDDHDSDCYYYSLEAFEENAEHWFATTYPEAEITGDTLVVDFCNYKGEGDGFGLYLLNKNLPIFVSKNDSFYAVN